MVTAAIGFISCKKSNDSQVSPPTPCNKCILTANPWNLNEEIIITDAGSYTHPKDQIRNTDWASFIFNSNYTYEDHTSAKGTYVYYDGTSNSDPSIVLTPGNGSFDIRFTIPSITKDSLTLDLPKLQVHPLTDMSAAAVSEYHIVLSNLHDDFAVDTANVKWILPSFKYYR